MNAEVIQKQFERADQQRFLALKYAFEVIDVYAYPSFTTDQFEEYDKLKKILIANYKAGSNGWLEFMNSD